MADITFVWLFAGVHQVVLLKMGKLGEAFRADVTLKGSLSRMRTQVHLEIAQLSKCLVTNVTLVVHLAIFLLKRIRQASITTGTGRQFRVRVVVVIHVHIVIVRTST